MPRQAEPVRLHAHAAEHLRFIRDTMARASAFTAIPGWGGALMGATALVAAAVAPRVGARGWLSLWLVEAALAVAIGIVATILEARHHHAPVMIATARRFVLVFLPSIVAGAALTLMCVEHDLLSRLPGCWLLCYGAAVTSGGVVSMPRVAVMGLCLMACGVAASVSPDHWGNAWMGAGFGVVQIGFGLAIARRHGG